mmetsp:Transcript_12821/g.15513  ORF Transcript_12821/g.15513 Transcript_12821/m.15513 type:complete len:203 (+) Transcript_12821:1746-2354(+)
MVQLKLEAHMNKQSKCSNHHTMLVKHAYNLHVLKLLWVRLNVLELSMLTEVNLHIHNYKLSIGIIGETLRLHTVMKIPFEICYELRDLFRLHSMYILILLLELQNNSNLQLPTIHHQFNSLSSKLFLPLLLLRNLKLLICLRQYRNVMIQMKLISILMMMTMMTMMQRKRHKKIWLIWILTIGLHRVRMKKVLVSLKLKLVN